MQRSTNPFWKLVVVAATLFCVTVLALVAATLGDPQAPVNRWLNRFAGTLILAEVLVTVLAALLALALDRRQSQGGEQDEGNRPGGAGLPGGE